MKTAASLGNPPAQHSLLFPGECKRGRSALTTTLYCKSADSFLPLHAPVPLFPLQAAYLGW